MYTPQIAQGYFTGDGGDAEVAVGFTPKLIKLTRGNNCIDVVAIDGEKVFETKTTTSAVSGTTAVDITEKGFIVGTDSDLNVDTEKTYYMVIG